MYQPYKHQHFEGSGRSLDIANRQMSLVDERMGKEQPQHLRPKLAMVQAVPFTFDDTFSSLLGKILIYFGLVNNFDHTSTSSSTGGHASRSEIKLYDSHHIQVCMIQELKNDHFYYLDLIDDELAITAMQAMRFQTSTSSLEITQQDTDDRFNPERSRTMTMGSMNFDFL